MNNEKIAILVDSCSDLSAEYCASNDIYILPLKIIYQEGEYSDGVNITAHNVYSRMPAEIPRTSLPGFDALEDVVTQIKSDGFEKILSISLSSGISGTFNMVRLACESFEGVEIVALDSLTGSIGIASMVLHAVALIEKGENFASVINAVSALIPTTRAFFSVDTLEYLQKGGRIGVLSGVVGTMLQIKPILTFSPEGNLVATDKVRGRMKSIEAIAEKIRALVPAGKPYILGMASGECPDDMDYMKSKLTDVIDGAALFVEGAIDATLATHVGPNLIGVGIQIL